MIYSPLLPALHSARPEELPEVGVVGREIVRPYDAEYFSFAFCVNDPADNAEQNASRAERVAVANAIIHDPSLLAFFGVMMRLKAAKSDRLLHDFMPSPEQCYQRGWTPVAAIEYWLKERDGLWHELRREHRNNGESISSLCDANGRPVQNLSRLDGYSLSCEWNGPGRHITLSTNTETYNYAVRDKETGHVFGGNVRFDGDEASLRVTRSQLVRDNKPVMRHTESERTALSERRSVMAPEDYARNYSELVSRNLADIMASGAYPNPRDARMAAIAVTFGVTYEQLRVSEEHPNPFRPMSPEIRPRTEMLEAVPA